MPPPPRTPDGLARVLLVEDDPLIGADVGRSLRASGYAVEWRRDGPDGLRQFAADGCDLVLLDLGLPTLDGLDVCRRIRADDMRTPILILSGRTEKRDVVRGLDLGADDYVTKPFHTPELLARVAGLLRRTAATGDGAAGDGAGPPPDNVRRGNLLIYPLARRVVLRGQPVALTPKEFDLLAALAGSPRQVLSRTQLLDVVWGSSPEWQDPATVTVHVRRVRQKVEACPERPRYLTTVWGVGYRFEP